ncbi:Intraflagellar transport protein [Dirofilaria immitis]
MKLTVVPECHMRPRFIHLSILLSAIMPGRHSNIYHFYVFNSFVLTVQSDKWGKLAIVDETGVCSTFDIKTKELLFQMFHADDFEMACLKTGACPFCHVAPQKKTNHSFIDDNDIE